LALEAGYYPEVNNADVATTVSSDNAVLLPPTAQLPSVTKFGVDYNIKSTEQAGIEKTAKKFRLPIIEFTRTSYWILS
jgi:hypothetical protein